LKLQERLSILSQLGEYLTANEAEWQQAKQKSTLNNAWFVPQFIDLAANTISRYFLQIEDLEAWAAAYKIPEKTENQVTVGLTMAGNIPLVGFHDWLTLFVSGQKQLVKPSAKDAVLLKHLIEKMEQWNPAIRDYMRIEERLNGCDAYIATGSNNSSRYFEYYFGRFPHIIRKNRTSAAILTGNETNEELQKLADDILLYFGLGCRNVSKIYVPKGYNFEKFLEAFSHFSWMKDHDKYRNNYDYQLSMLILNNHYYMSNEVLLMVEKEQLFSPISQLHYVFYDEFPKAEDLLQSMGNELQCLCGEGGYSFGKAQQPLLTDYADGVDTMAFCLQLKK
jgi:hypothetical protein